MGEDPEQLPSNAGGLPIAHRILAWDHIEHGEYQQAFSELSDAAALNPSDLWIRYYVSVAKYSMARAKHAEMMGLSNMMMDLKAVLEWYATEMAGAYDLLAVARNTGGGPSAALQSERAAITLSPRNERYIYHLAEIYVASKKWDAANALLGRLKASSDPTIAAQARDLIEQSGTERKYGIPVAANGTSQPESLRKSRPSMFLKRMRPSVMRTKQDPDRISPETNARLNSSRAVLVAVDCSKAPAAVLTVNSQAGRLTLRAADYRIHSPDWRRRFLLRMARPPSHGELQTEWRCQ